MSVLTRMSSRRSIFETFACFTSRILASSSAIARVRARARSRACLGSFATRLENFLAIARSFLEFVRVLDFPKHNSEGIYPLRNYCASRGKGRSLCGCSDVLSARRALNPLRDRRDDLRRLAERRGHAA